VGFFSLGGKGSGGAGGDAGGAGCLAGLDFAGAEVLIAGVDSGTGGGVVGDVRLDVVFPDAVAGRAESGARTGTVAPPVIEFTGMGGGFGVLSGDDVGLWVTSSLPAGGMA
jgi:hypothetical protein